MNGTRGVGSFLCMGHPPMVGETSLPDGKVGGDAVGEAAFDELHRSFKSDVGWSDEQVNVVALPWRRLLRFFCRIASDTHRSSLHIFLTSPALEGYDTISELCSNAHGRRLSIKLRRSWKLCDTDSF